MCGRAIHEAQQHLALALAPTWFVRRLVPVIMFSAYTLTSTSMEC